MIDNPHYRDDAYALAYAALSEPPKGPSPEWQDRAMAVRTAQGQAWATLALVDALRSIHALLYSVIDHGEPHAIVTKPAPVYRMTHPHEKTPPFRPDPSPYGNLRSADPLGGLGRLADDLYPRGEKDRGAGE